MRFLKFIFVCALIVGGGYAACQIAYPTLYLRYKLTVNVSDHGVIKTGSGVVEISYTMFTEVFNNAGPSGSYGIMHGNAITVDLGQHNLLFVINRQRNPQIYVLGEPIGAAATLSDLPLIAYGFFEGLTRSSILKKQVLAVQNMPHTPVDVPSRAMPAIVRLRDIEDPLSIEEIDALPSGIERDQSDLHFVSATLQLTNEPLTPTPANWPDWLRSGDPKTFIVDPWATFSKRKWPQPPRVRTHKHIGVSRPL